jgi:hypothetical protein
MVKKGLYVTRSKHLIRVLTVYSNAKKPKLYLFDGQPQNIRGDGKFIFPFRALYKVFRAKYSEALKEKSPDNYTRVKKQP